MTWQHISVPLIKVLIDMTKAAEETNEKINPKRKPGKAKQ